MSEKIENRLTEEQRRIVSQALWDLSLTPEELIDIIEGKLSVKWPDRGFCMARLLESVNWFDLVKILEPSEICRLWGEARKHVRRSSIKEGMDFACKLLQ